MWYFLANFLTSESNSAGGKSIGIFAFASWYLRYLSASALAEGLNRVLYFLHIANTLNHLDQFDQVTEIFRVQLGSLVNGIQPAG